MKYINFFGEEGGFEHVRQVLNGEFESQSQNVGSLVRLVQSACENLVQPFIQKHGRDILTHIKAYVKDSVEKDLRNISKESLQIMIEGINSLAERVHSIKEAR